MTRRLITGHTPATVIRKILKAEGIERTTNAEANDQLTQKALRAYELTREKNLYVATRRA